MSLHRQNPRRDVNEKGIVDALQAAGAIVLRLSGKGCPDLLVRFRGTWTPLEVKTKRGQLTEAQAITHALAPFAVVRTPEQALKEIGAVSGHYQFPVVRV